ncbi:anti-sigma factor RsbA family regulatory protein [Oryzihumus leptocrescens]|nr:anti-sigma factor RsbA family regulatory protein [Oryzihumus leptocrescens]
MSARAMHPTGDWTGKAFAHEAFLYSSDEEAVARCVPFVQEGLDRGEPVIVVASEAVREALLAHLGDEAGRLAVVAASEGWWQGGFGTLAAYDRDLQQLRANGTPWRLIGEPTWLALPDGRVWSRFEAVANDAYADLPYYSLCLHDTRRLAPDVLEAVLRSHPMTWGGTEPVASPTYEDTATFLRQAEPAWTERPAGALVRQVGDARQARALVGEVLGGEQAGEVGGLAGEREQDALIAVNELVSNALRAAGSAEVSTWREDGCRVWEVADSGPGFHAATAGYVPPADDLDCGRGLWLARGLASDATVRATGEGAAIRLFFRD